LRYFATYTILQAMVVFKGKGWAQIYAHKEGERCTGEEGYYLAITLKAELTSS